MDKTGRPTQPGDGTCRARNLCDLHGAGTISLTVGEFSNAEAGQRVTLTCGGTPWLPSRVPVQHHIQVLLQKSPHRNITKPVGNPADPEFASFSHQSPPAKARRIFRDQIKRTFAPNLQQSGCALVLD